MSEPAVPTNGWRPSLKALAARGEAVALQSDGETTTYAQLAGRAEAIANALLDAGVQTGDHVALLSAGRGHDEAAGLLGVILAGGVVVPLHHGAPRAQIANVMRAANCRAIVHDEKSADHVRDIGAPDPPLRVELDDEGF
ncbi:MAG: AMP-binding protein, partial [Polyangiaceae bacterium]